MLDWDPKHTKHRESHITTVSDLLSCKPTRWVQANTAKALQQFPPLQACDCHTRQLICTDIFLLSKAWDYYSFVVSLANSSPQDISEQGSAASCGALVLHFFSPYISSIFWAMCCCCDQPCSSWCQNNSHLFTHCLKFEDSHSSLWMSKIFFLIRMEPARIFTSSHLLFCTSHCLQFCYISVFIYWRLCISRSGKLHIFIHMQAYKQTQKAHKADTEFSKI